MWINELEENWEPNIEFDFEFFKYTIENDLYINFLIGDYRNEKYLEIISKEEKYSITEDLSDRLIDHKLRLFLNITNENSKYYNELMFIKKIIQKILNFFKLEKSFSQIFNDDLEIIELYNKLLTDDNIQNTFFSLAKEYLYSWSDGFWKKFDEIERRAPSEIHLQQISEKDHLDVEGLMEILEKGN